MLYIPSSSHLPVLLFLTFVVYQDSMKSPLAGSTFSSRVYPIYIHGFNYDTPRRANETTTSQKYRSSDTFSCNYAGRLTLCEYQASGENHFQYGRKWKVNLPVKNKIKQREEERKYFTHSLLNIAQLFFLPPLWNWIQSSSQEQKKEKMVKLEVGKQTRHMGKEVIPGLSNSWKHILRRKHKIKDPWIP